MLKGLGNLAEMFDMLKQAGRLRGELDRVMDELKQLVVEGSAGGGMVKVRMNGKMELLDCKIDPQVFADHDAEMLEDLVVAAMNQAMEKSRAVEAEKIGQLFGGVKIPGLSEALRQLGGSGS